MNNETEELRFEYVLVGGSVVELKGENSNSFGT